MNTGERPSTRKKKRILMSKRVTYHATISTNKWLKCKKATMKSERMNNNKNRKCRFFLRNEIVMQEGGQCTGMWLLYLLCRDKTLLKSKQMLIMTMKMLILNKTLRKILMTLMKMTS